MLIAPGFYTITALESGGECIRGGCEVLEADGHLIKVRQGQEVWIMNTAASTFISAKPVEPPTGGNPFADFA